MIPLRELNNQITKDHFREQSQGLPFELLSVKRAREKRRNIHGLLYKKIDRKGAVFYYFKNGKTYKVLFNCGADQVNNVTHQHLERAYETMVEVLRKRQEAFIEVTGYDIDITVNF